MLMKESNSWPLVVPDDSGLPIWPPCSGYLFASDSVYEIDDYVIFLYSKAVKVLPNSFCQGVFTLPTGLLLPNHCWRVMADATRARQH